MTGDRDTGAAPETMCVEDADGTARPMRDVLAERRRRYLERPKAEREAAFRERAFLQGVLQACTCSWPVVKAETATEHEPWCTAHAWLVRREDPTRLHP